MKTSPGPICITHSRRGFTLIELLVVAAIIAILAGIAMPVYQGVILKAKMTRELQAGRTLIAAFVSAAADRDGVFPGGYDRTVNEVILANGTPLSGVPAQRYPFRLAPYFSNQLNGTILVNDNIKDVDTTSNYVISCYPALAINYLFVGGDISATGTLTYPDECVTRMANASSSPLVFASGAGDGSPSRIHGYCILTPPQTNGSMWSSSKWTTTSSASDYGNVDPRYNKKAVCVFLDGSTKLLGIEDLRDMRFWSKNAAEQNNPNYVIPRASTGGRL